jgi:putative MATE family efflux protein
MDKNISMTEGNIWKQLITFSIPLILGNAFQQLYNTIDSIIVGNFVGSNELAAIGACDPAINIVLGFSVGLSAGAGVIVSNYYGAENLKGIKKAVHCIMALSVVAGGVLTIFSFFLLPVFMKYSGLPDEVRKKAFIYLMIYCFGIFFQVVFNMLSGIMNAVGNSKRTLIYLSMCSVINIIFDLLLVICFRMGIVGVAIGTVISEAASCMMAFLFMIRSKSIYKINVKEIRLHKNLTSYLIKISVPTGMQNVVRAFANMIVQMSINHCGTAAIAGYAIYLRIDGFNWLPAMSLGVAAATFAGQNMGAKKSDRIRKGILVEVAISIIYTTCSAIVLLWFEKQILSIFTSDKEVIFNGGLALRWFTPFYFLYAILMALSGTLRGIGKAFDSMMVSILSLCVFRVIAIAFINMFSYGFTQILVIYPLSWLVGTGIAVIYLKKARILNRRDLK